MSQIAGAFFAAHERTQIRFDVRVCHLLGALISGAQSLRRPVDFFVIEHCVKGVAQSTDATARRIALKAQIAATTDALRNATTDAEVQKLSGVLVGLSSALNNTDYEIHQATASAIVQDIANRNEVQRQT